MATQGSNLSTAFVIKELTGDRRTLTLRERALPYRPFELSGTQRNTVEWYPGSPIGVAQVYGAKEEPTTITGQWKDKFLGFRDSRSQLVELAPASLDYEGPSGVKDAAGEEILAAASQSIQTARDLVKIVDDFRRKGQEIEVSWLDQIRRGLIERFSVKWTTGHDCEWEIGFVWISQGESLQDVALVNPATNLGDVPGKVQGYLDEINDTDAASLVPQAGGRFSDAITTVDSVAANLQDFADALVSSIGSATTEVLSTPNEAIRRVAGILDGIKLEGNAMSEIMDDVLDGIALDFGATSPADAPASFSVAAAETPSRSFGEVLALRGKIRDRSRAATGLRDFAANEQMVLLRKIAPTVVAVFQARDGQDLRTVSQTYYGTPDEWRSLMVFNGLASSGLVAGQVVFVPASPYREAVC